MANRLTQREYLHEEPGGLPPPWFGPAIEAALGPALQAALGPLIEAALGPAIEAALEPLRQGLQEVNQDIQDIHEFLVNLEPQVRRANRLAAIVSSYS